MLSSFLVCGLSGVRVTFTYRYSTRSPPRARAAGDRIHRCRGASAHVLSSALVVVLGRLSRSARDRCGVRLGVRPSCSPLRPWRRRRRLLSAETLVDLADRPEGRPTATCRTGALAAILSLMVLVASSDASPSRWMNGVGPRARSDRRVVGRRAGHGRPPPAPGCFRASHAHERAVRGELAVNALARRGSSWHRGREAAPQGKLGRERLTSADRVFSRRSTPSSATHTEFELEKKRAWSDGE
jgi:hypothetical protein